MPYHEPSHSQPSHNEPIHGELSHARSAPAATATVKVIPAVDLYLGTVTIPTRNRTLCFLCTQTAQIAEALARAVRPSTWCGASGTLTVTVAAAGQREGRPCTFILSRETA
ncbi:hypothetical protein [Paenarthrobacter sp. JL.01a]|uniref:hypothetical protein n=1 Tax=Paenarthrobacter sp. JL.01a TaxID=2979324 RepID=UPI0021C603C1|nr:hypothetical protein [Paenarthrobacter sp. JL.01a]UXM92766.1 hypothetical protein N5P29_05420 [Paenarthrobacter sp. JL.01a]